MLRGLAITLLLFGCSLAVVDGAKAIPPNSPFEIGGTYGYSWTDDYLEVDIHVTGRGLRESAVWTDPCGPLPPGYTMVYTASGEMSGWYNLYDESGDRVKLCSFAPNIEFKLPTNLAVRISDGCGKGGGVLDVTSTRVAVGARAGTAAREELLFSAEGSYSYPFSPAGPYVEACLIERSSTSHPNPECAEFFDAELCAREYEAVTTRWAQAALKFTPTPTAACPRAKKADRRLSKRLKALNAAVRRAHRPNPRLLERVEKMRSTYRYTVNARFIGECK